MLPGKIFGLFYMYGLMIAIGILSALGLLYFFGKKKNVPEKFIDYVFYNGIASIAIGFGSATLFQSFYNYLEDPSQGFKLGGMTFIGGVIGGVACFLIIHAIMRKRYKTSFLRVQSFAPCAILVAHAFGRLGCLFAGCCHGAKTDAWYGIYMHTNTFGYAKVVPTQLFEALFLFALFAVCFLLVMKKDFKYNFTIYLVAYGIWRFCIEFLRADHRGTLVDGISPSQFWAIVMVVAGIVCYFFLRFLYKREEKLAAERANVVVEPIAETVVEVQPAVVTSDSSENVDIPSENADDTGDSLS